jgi:hypothetical protein
MIRATKPLTLDQQDELHVIQCCLSAIADLMSPERDLHAVNRDNLAMLLGYFTERMKEVTRGSHAGQ